MYWCDFKVRKPVILSTTGAVNYALRKFWDWSGYLGDATGCAAGIVGLWYGNPIGLAVIRDCGEGPM